MEIFFINFFFLGGGRGGGVEANIVNQIGNCNFRSIVIASVQMLLFNQQQKCGENQLPELVMFAWAC